jgi:hypothetical protein
MTSNTDSTLLIYATRHIRVKEYNDKLRSAGVVATQKQGAAHICRLNAKPLRAVSAWLLEYEAFWDARLRGLKDYVESPKNRKERNS